ncbi:DHA2 family efflux MFS transporter permease subunit [Clostridium estertheticum]|uniref:DHA2 family efflux MFS transporter permease subunit n=1 Tax=Clostridium estertheticum TaxID=238834 RepID=A0AA47I5K3_9CLOT|nr:DHA2 family efflux MFS transporter permease subunit [Clostridium estertheticum]MBU3155416.1 DHA2 family efflux MFS transporter permease subunit [Clostridium estertheticum]MBU3199486.1 DHA2 family efflux MFS transporter permease subunit [Clostridium estertheticum]WAG60487.1 DHA2 family efflux MFS transporter permease subunit [Clostridium estertheticum]WAG65436.1 DHA2 family efflux MFS transporter permease subunit [Clostridium estertheticum]
MENKGNDNSNRWLVLFVVIIGTFMSVLDSSIVNIAVPTLMSVFGVDLDKIKWVLTAYTLALGVVIPFTGYLMERYDFKQIYMFALGMFSVGSLLCGLAWSNNTMIIFRIIQALGGGMIMPVGMAVVFSLFPPNERGKALGIWGVAAMVAPAIGPTLGGYLLQTTSWRLLFYINVPIGIAGVILAGIIMKKGPKKPKIAFDYLGFISISISLVSLLYVLGEGTIDWSNIETQMLITIGCLGMVFFVINELTHDNPLLELRIFKELNFSISQGLSIITTLAMMGGMYVLPLFLQNVRGFTAMETGMIMFPSAIASGIMMPISGALFDKFGAKALTITGLIIVGIASYKFTFLSMGMSKETITMLNLIRGVGMGLCMMPVNTAGMNCIPPHLTAKASALSNTIRQVTSSLSVTIMTSLIQSRNSFNYAKLANEITPFNQVAVNYMKTLTGVYMNSGYSAANAKVAAVTAIAGGLARQAYIDAQTYAIAVTSLAIVFGIVLVLFLREKKQLPKVKSVDSMQEEMHMADMLE